MGQNAQEQMREYELTRFCESVSREAICVSKWFMAEVRLMM